MKSPYDQGRERNVSYISSLQNEVCSPLQATHNKDQEVKKKYIRMALGSSAVLLVAGVFAMIAIITVYVLALAS